MEPIHKFNSGMGGMICNTCRTIISTGQATKELYCEKCKPKEEIIMKNIHVIPTDKPSRLYCYKSIELYLHSEIVDANSSNLNCKNQNIYITSNEEIKEGDWFLANNGVHKCIRVDDNTSCPFITLNSKGEEIGHFKTWKTKIIQTTDQSLDGVQAIPDEFLEWFVKNPSCEEVDIDAHVQSTENGHILYYQIIIPKDEPKLKNICIKCGVDLYATEGKFECQKHPKECKGVYLSEETLLIHAAEQKQNLIDMMKADEELGLYEEPKQETIKIACVQCCGTGEIQKSTNRKQSNFECDLCNGRGHWNKVIEPKQENALEEKEWLIIFKEYVKDNECNLYTFFNWLETNYNSPTKK